MERVGEHPIPAGPLAVRWLGYRLPEFRAMADTIAEVVLQNAGRATWRPRASSASSSPTTGSTIVATRSSGTARTSTSATVRPGDEVEVELLVRAPQPPGRYRLAFDLVEELRFWFAEIGSHALELDAEVLPLIDERRLAVVVRGGADSRRPRRSRRRRSRPSKRTPSPTHTSSPVRCRRPTGRAGSSTPMPRASSPSAARSSRPTGRSGPGPPAAAATPPSRIPCCCRRSCRPRAG